MSERIVILGAGESGVGAALLARSRGYDVFVSDNGIIKDSYSNELLENNISFEKGTHTLERILKADEIVKSPGIPENIELLNSIREKGIPVISEIEFAGRFTDAKFILITGTNGKTTTCLLINHILRSAGMNVGSAGNVGKSLARAVLEDAWDYYVVEVSSFQLDGIKDFKADISVLLNITPDHLDRYNYDFSQYVNSKFRVIRNMGAEGTFIYFADDEDIIKEVNARDIPANKLPFTILDNSEYYAFKDNENLNFHLNNKSLSISQRDLPMKGNHNQVNIMASVLTAMVVDVDESSIINGLKTFENRPHRMELVADVNGVEYVNDSKATNVESVFYALEAYPSIIWIAGGIDKGNEYERIKEVVKNNVKALICLGKDNDKLKRSFSGIIDDIDETDNIYNAVRNAYEKAEKGDTVLLSPACASFDLFENYEDRGDRFKDAVLKLKKESENYQNKVL